MEETLFPHSVIVSWPIPQPQIDFVDQIITVEGWLESNMGPQGVRWAWIPREFAPSWLCCVQFAKETDALMFSLRWG